jgi:serine/threonine protein kinase
LVAFGGCWVEAWWFDRGDPYGAPGVRESGFTVIEPLQPGDPQVVGPYRLVGRLGHGGMGVVFYGRSRSGRPVAVKVIRPDLAADVDFRRRFGVEVEAARRVGGFYTAQVVDAEPDGDPPWLVTAYVPGPSLAEAVNKHGPLPVDSVRALGAGLAEGLAAIHSCGLVHRDLKPGNVILASDGPRVIDFGIVRAVDATTYTVPGTVMGSPAFMSPEQARAGTEIGPASDVFSLGSVLAFAAGGIGPFGSGTPTTVLYRIVWEDPDLTQVTGPLRDMIAACLAKDPADRLTVPQILDHLASSSDATGHWLPAEVTAVIAVEPTLTFPHTNFLEHATPRAEPGPTAARLVEDGIVKGKAGDLEAAPDLFTRALLTGDPDQAPRAMAKLGVLLEEQGDVEGARAAYQQAIDSGHTDQAPRAMANLAILLKKQEDVEGARAAYQQAIHSGHTDQAPDARKIWLIRDRLLRRGRGRDG